MADKRVCAGVAVDPDAGVLKDQWRQLCPHLVACEELMHQTDLVGVGEELDLGAGGQLDLVALELQDDAL